MMNDLRWNSGGGPYSAGRPGMNNPPTPLVGFRIPFLCIKITVTEYLGPLRTGKGTGNDFD